MMNEARINQFKDQIRGIMRQVLDVGEEPPEFIQDLLIQLVQKVSSKIKELREEDKLREPVQPPVSTGPSNDAQLLWVLSGQDPQAFISYLRTFPTPGTSALLNDPHALNSTIEQLNSMMPPGEPIVVDGIPHADLQSSNVWGAAFDPKSKKMRVRFQGGSEYEYDGVPENIFNAFIKGNAVARTTGHNQYGKWWRGKNPSIGAAMNQYIKQGNFPYRKIR
jgi:hypothetical protein